MERDDQGQHFAFICFLSPVLVGNDSRKESFKQTPWEHTWIWVEIRGGGGWGSATWGGVVRVKIWAWFFCLDLSRLWYLFESQNIEKIAYTNKSAQKRVQIALWSFFSRLKALIATRKPDTYKFEVNLPCTAGSTMRSKAEHVLPK
jgi:hypothetical protein